MNRTAKNRKEIKAFLNQVDQLCNQLRELERILDQFDRYQFELRLEQRYNAKMLLNKLIEMNKDISPKAKL